MHISGSVFFFNKIQDWILKCERIWKRILRFFTNLVNPRSLGSWCIKGTEESPLEMDSSVPLTRHDPSDLNILNKEAQNPFSDSFGFKNPILDFLKETHPQAPLSRSLWTRHHWKDLVLLRRLSIHRRWCQFWSKVMTSEVEEKPRLVTGGYGRHRSQWVKAQVNELNWNFRKCKERLKGKMAMEHHQTVEHARKGTPGWWTTV